MVYLACFLLFCTLVSASRTVIGCWRIENLANVSWDESRTDGQWPHVSIVVAARNEEQDVERAVQSLLKLNYPSFELMVVDDRSTDRTGLILDSLSEECSSLRVFHVTTLPDGWLGKNHALHVGAEQSAGEFVLFTDADVIYEPSTLRRALTYVETRGLDHLTATPRTIMPSALLNSFATTFAICFLTYFPPWKAKDPNSSIAVGIGAFNLVRREAYESIGGHESLRMRPDDDVKLGKVLKRSGFQQDVVHGTGMISVPWYRTLRDAIVGLEKNTFSGVDYSILTTVSGSLALLMLSVWPFVALFFSSGLTWCLYACLCAAQIAFAGWTTQVIGVPLRSCLFHPVSVCLIVFIMWRTMLLTFRNNGIFWRDTHYRLEELKANKV